MEWGHLTHPVARAAAPLGFGLRVWDGVVLEKLDECPGAADEAIFPHHYFTNSWSLAASSRTVLGPPRSCRLNSMRLNQ